MTARLIALCSPVMGSGKSTAAEHLVTRHGFIRLAFATPLKAMTVALLQAAGMPGGEIEDRVYGGQKEDPIPFLGASARHIMQTLGTEWGRELIHPDIWVNITLANARSYLDRGQSVVIDDMRFPNEYNAVIGAGGECYRVVRPQAAVTVAHVSEGQLDGVAMPEIWNDVGMEKLYRAIDALV